MRRDEVRTWMHGRQLVIEVDYRRQGGNVQVGLWEETRQGGGHGGRPYRQADVEGARSSAGRVHGRGGGV